jgi:hypothetical protein
MKLVKEHINEKFVEDSDPIKDMGIGIDRHRVFKNRKELTNWVFKNLAHIIGTEKIPEDIIKDEEWFLKKIYTDKIREYAHKYFTCGNSYWEFDTHPYWKELRNKLRKKGYKLISLREHIDEKFTLEGDPIKDMGIGLYVKRDFNNKEKFLEFLLQIIPAILKKNSIPKDILHAPGTINEKYFNIIDEFLTKYITFKGIGNDSPNSEVYFWNDLIRPILLEMGYKNEVS